MIYLDNAATTLHKPPEVAEAELRAMGTMGNGGRGVHGGALTAARTVYGARAALADFFGCGDPSRVCFTANSTEALNIALFGLLSPGDHVITTDLEHNSVLRPLYRLEQSGVRLTILPADRQGNIAYEAMEAAIGPDTRLIACTHASNLTGNLLDFRRIGGIAQRHGLLLVVDASQTAGSVPIDMGDLGISVLARSACMDELRKGKIAALPIENLSMVRETNIVYRRDFSYPDILQGILATYQSTTAK